MKHRPSDTCRQLKEKKTNISSENLSNGEQSTVSHVLHEQTSLKDLDVAPRQANLFPKRGSFRDAAQCSRFFSSCQSHIDLESENELI